MSYNVTQAVELSCPGFGIEEAPLRLPKEIPTLSLKITRSCEVHLVWKGASSEFSIEEGYIDIAAGRYSARLDFRRGVFPQVSTGQLVFPGTVVHGHAATYPVVISLETSGRSPVKAGNSDAKSFVTSLVDKKLSNCCLYFPRSNRRLWVTQATLATISPYFETLFTSEFAETTQLTEVAESSEVDHEEAEDDLPGMEAHDFDDSDIETDVLTKSTFNDPEDPQSMKYMTIKITQHTCETYLNLLCWVGTGQIEFAPLRSTFIYPSASAANRAENPRSRSELLSKAMSNSLPRVPSPVSPKSMYRLAHFLELNGDLGTLALSNFASQLTVENVMYELYTDVASKYTEIQDIAFSFAVKHWSSVRKTQAYKDVLQRANDEGIDGATGLLLSEKLSDAWENRGK
ncbi:uncharacterized protein JCM6883_002210 [Sporobolomyces salmoneus]|uniref:uncharacterized protein n=1 Tax=Sporobolomyces salmoneus TaxID=183962 RepID=UPI00316FC96B